MPTIGTNLEPYIERVRVELEKHLSKNEGAYLINLQIVDVAQRSFSNIVFLLAETSAGTQRMVMKKVVHHPINMAITKRENQATVEYEILTNLYPKFKEVEGCAVPRPILVIPEIETFLMEFVRGRPLSDELCYARYWANKAKFERLRRYYYLCGKWLRHFQEFTGSEKAGPEAFDSLLERCDLRLKLIEEVGNSRCPKDLRHRTMDLLREQLSGLGNGNVMIIGRHGDFGHWNILVDGEGITVLDFLGFSMEPIAYDLTKILISFEAWNKDPICNGSRIKALRSSFLEGFGTLPFVYNAEAVICEIYHRISVIYACLSNPGEDWVERLKRRRILETNLKALTHIPEGKIIWLEKCSPSRI